MLQSDVMKNKVSCITSEENSDEAFVVPLSGLVMCTATANNNTTA